MTPLLEVRNVRKVFGSGRGFFKSKRQVVALDNFSLVIPDDSPTFTAVAGESGSGKTTLANLILGFLSPSSGQVLYRGQDLTQMTRDQWRVFRREVQAVFQDPFEVYNPFYKVDHLLMTAIAKFKLAASKADANGLMVNALQKVGLRPEDTLGRFPHQLSGGQRQRVTIARALLLKPRLIIADEPVSMVDASLRATILENLRTLYQDFGISFLYITHDLTTAYQICQNIIVLYQGAIAEIGAVDHVIKDPKHPYTQELVASVPWPDPDRHWGQTAAPARSDEAPKFANNGCKYAGRCPFAMAVCRENAPPLYQTEDHRAVACYLYQDAPVLDREHSTDVLSAAVHVLTSNRESQVSGLSP
jgi:oligopeptide/dipeptide ABC transporter ATP-binding protein